MAAPTIPPSKSSAPSPEAQRLRFKLQEQFRETDSLRRRLAASAGEHDPSSVTLQPIALTKNVRHIHPTEPTQSEAWWPTAVFPSKALVPTPGWASLSLQRHNSRVIGFIVFGMTGDKLDRTVDLISVSQRASMNFIPLFLTDSVDFSSFRKHGYVLEFMSAAEVSNPKGRLDYLRRKWGIRSIIDLRDS